MKQYIDIVKHVLENGQGKFPTRRNSQTGEFEPVDGGVLTLACPNVVFSHDMSEGFPLLTTKKMAWKSIRVELEGFIKGVTSKKWFQERGCHIWAEWCNPEVLKQKMDREWKPITPDGGSSGRKKALTKAMQKEADDLGPIYGYQWRKFGEHYDKDRDRENFRILEHEYVSGCNGLMHGTDQLALIVDKLKNDPMDRRMVCSAWNPNQAHMQALPPCHTQWGCTVIGNELHLRWDQRSCDLMLGVPFNIASYALLQTLLCEVGGFEPGNLTGILADCHIYENQIDAAREQITREPRPLPKVGVLKHMNLPQRPFDIFDWNYDTAVLTDYNPHAKIKFGDVVV